MRSVLLASILLTVGGCRKSSPGVAALAPDAGAPVLEFAAPTAPSTLSLFEPAGEGCEWRQLDPVAGKRVVLARFPGTCVGARLAWTPDGSRALVWFDPQHVQSAGYSSQLSSKPGYADEVADAKASPRAFLVSTRRQQVEPMPFPAVPGLTLQELGLDETGAVLALLEQPVPEGTKGTFVAAGQTFDLSTLHEGVPVVVHAYRREGADWKRVESKLSTTGWDYGLGVRELEAFRRFGPRSADLAASHAQGDVAEDAVLPALMTLAPKDAGADDGQWIFLGAGGARIYVWEISGEFAHSTGLIALGTPGPKPLPKLGFTDGDLVAVRTSGAHLLITGSHVGTHPRLYELPAGKLIFSSDSARAATFWPTTAKPDSHKAP